MRLIPQLQIKRDDKSDAARHTCSLLKRKFIYGNESLFYGNIRLSYAANYCSKRVSREASGTEGRHREKKQAEENETAYRRDSVFRCSYS